MNPYKGVGGSYFDNKLGYSSASKHYGHSNRNVASNEDHNLGELEFMLDNERKKFRQAKEKFEYDLDNERKLRIEFENKLIKLKDQYSRKEVQKSQLEFRVNNLLHQNQDVLVENDRLRHQLARLEEVYGGKVHELESQLSMETRNFDDVTAQYNTEFEKFKKQGQQYVEQLNFDFERKLKNAEEKAKQAEMIKRDLTLENKKLNDIIISNKLNFEEEIREVKNRAREEDLRKHQQFVRSHEQKIKVVEEAKEVLIRKNQQLQRYVQQKERHIQEIQADKNDEISRLRQDNGDLQQQVNQMNYFVSKLKNQIAEKDSLIGRSYNDNDQQLSTLKQQLELRKGQNVQLSSTIRDLRMALKDSEGEWERKRRQLLQRCNFFEGESKKYKDQYQRICDILKSRINETINHVSHKK